MANQSNDLMLSISTIVGKGRGLPPRQASSPWFLVLWLYLSNQMLKIKQGDSDTGLCLPPTRVSMVKCSINVVRIENCFDRRAETTSPGRQSEEDCSDLERGDPTFMQQRLIGSIIRHLTQRSFKWRESCVCVPVIMREWAIYILSLGVVHI